MTQTVLVLGATGKTGRRLVPRLVARGVTVRAASRQPGEGRTLFDWDRPETHQPALAGVDAIYLIGVEFPHEAPESGRRKLERQVMASGLEWTILRPTGIAQNFSEGFLLPGILEADTVVTATGDGAVAFVDANDIAAVAAAALTQDGHAKAEYTITGPEALTFAKAAAAISQVTGRTITHRSISSEEMAQLLQDAGVVGDYAAMLLRDMEAVRDGWGDRVTDVVEQVAGRPATPFANYASRAARAWSRP